MTQRDAGIKADATIVVNLVREQFTNPAKDAIRAWVVAELKAAEPTLVLDLWGGGRSAEEMTAAGLSVLSVEDGRAFEGLGVSKPRIRRALETKAEAGGYRSAWGPARKFAPECDAAWLDFMGHLSGETVRVLEACRGMKAIAVTLMPDRMAGVMNLSTETWETMYRAAIEHHAQVFVRKVRRYKREGGGWALVVFARGQSRAEAKKACRKKSEEARLRDRARQKLAREQPGFKERKNAAERARAADPDYREKRRRSRREWEVRTGRNELLRMRYATDPEYREKKRELQRARRAADPEAAREYQRLRRAADPDAARAKRRAWALANPDKVAAQNARRRASHALERAAKKAAIAGES